MICHTILFFVVVAKNLCYSGLDSTADFEFHSLFNIINAYRSCYALIYSLNIHSVDLWKKLELHKIITFYLAKWFDSSIGNIYLILNESNISHVLKHWVSLISYTNVFVCMTETGLHIFTSYHCPVMPFHSFILCTSWNLSHSANVCQKSHASFRIYFVCLKVLWCG